MIFKNLKRNARLALLLGLALPSLAACGGADALFNNPLVNNKTKFSSSKYGVAASPRLTSGARVKKKVGGVIKLANHIRSLANGITLRNSPITTKPAPHLGMVRIFMVA